MKTQIKFQKILSLLTLIVAAIAFVYSLCFFSGNLSDLMWYKGVDQSDMFNGADNFIYLAQGMINSMVYMCVVYFVVIAFIYITSTNSRRNYYITNYIMVGIVVAYALMIAIYGAIMLAMLMSSFYGMDWAALNEYYEINEPIGAPEVSQSPVIFIIGMIVYVIVLINAVALIYNLIWKIKLMKGEKELLSKGFVKEVA